MDLYGRSVHLDIHPWAPSPSLQATVPAGAARSRAALGQRGRPCAEVPLAGLHGVGEEVRCVGIGDHLPTRRLDALPLNRIPGDVLHFRAYNQHIIVINSEEAATELLERRSVIYSSRLFVPMWDL